METAAQSIARQRKLLEIEYEDEKKSFAEASRRVGVTRLVERGDAWADVNFGKSFHNSLNQRVVEVFRNLSSSDTDAEDHHFEYGRPVSFFIASHPGGVAGELRTVGSGTVSYVDGQRMVVVIPENLDLQPLQNAVSAGVMLSFDETTYRLMFEALDRVARA